ncbi:MAG TPA: ABC transporter permease [Candidatus Sulfotelmatobacter sp.]|nr:ABC transporter permease [Candidatus Sulfotelmatobacter sp.]
MSIFQDIRYALRLLVKSRVSTTVAILSLALGIGATTAIFSVVYAVLVDPYPYAGAERIGGPWVLDAKGQRGISYTMAEYLEMQAQAKSIESIILNDRRSVVMTEAGLPEAVIQEYFSPNAFEFFGVSPLFGRTFSSRDAGDQSKAEPVAVLSYLFWQRHFSGRRDVLGQQIRLNDKFFTVIGVLPVRFTWNDADIYVPLEIHPGGDERYGMVLKVKPGVPKDQVNAEFQSFHEKFVKTAPSFLYPEPPFRTEFKSVNDNILGKFANTLLALLAAVGFLLLIACANVANLLLARASARQGEIALRVALGAGRKRVIQQLLTESVMLSMAGGALGVALAYGGVKAVVALMPEYSVPHEAAIAINVPVLCFSVAVSVLTGILFGLAPALQLSNQNQATFLKDAGRDSGSGTAGHRLRDVLIVSEVTLSLVLLTGAALAAAGMLELTRQKLGYQPKGVLTIYVPVPAARYPQWSQRQTFFADIIEHLRRLPAVESAAAAATGVPPYSGAELKFDMAGLQSLGAKIRVNLVSDAYFNTIGIPLLKGRYFDAADVTRAAPVAVVTEDMVKKYFPPGQDPIGGQIRLDLPTEGLPPGFVKPPQTSNAYQIVGVCGTVRNSGLRDQAEPAVYVPVSHLFPPGMMFAIRTKSDPLALSNGARQAVSAVDPSQPIAFVRSLDELLSNAVAYPRFATFLFGIFGAIGLTLACTGIFSVVSYAVSRRTREFGIRMALGATPGNVLRLILGSTGRVLTIGFAFGAILSVVSGRALAGKLEGIGVASPSMLVAIISVLAVPAFLACAIPARSATKVQPVDALRHE